MPRDTICSSVAALLTLPGDALPSSSSKIRITPHRPTAVSLISHKFGVKCLCSQGSSAFEHLVSHGLVVSASLNTARLMAWREKFVP